MPQLNDCKFNALLGLGFTGHIDDMELAWLQSLGATSDQINDAWVEYILSDANPDFLEVIPQPFAFDDSNWVTNGNAVIIDSNNVTFDALAGSGAALEGLLFVEGNLVVTRITNITTTVDGDLRINITGSPNNPVLFPVTSIPSSHIVINTVPSAPVGLYRLQNSNDALARDVTVEFMEAFMLSSDAYNGLQINDLKFAYMKSRGAVGEHYNDVQLDFWCNVMLGRLGAPPANGLTTDSGEFLITDDDEYITEG